MSLFNKKAKVNLMILGEPYPFEEPSWNINEEEKEQWLIKFREGYIKGLEFSIKKISNSALDDIALKITTIEKNSGENPTKKPEEFSFGLGLVIGILRDGKYMKHVLLGLTEKEFRKLIDSFEGGYQKTIPFIKAIVERNRSLPEIDAELLRNVIQRKKQLYDLTSLEF